MDTKELLKIMDFISKSDLNEVKIETEDLKISVKKDGDVIQHLSAPVATHHVAPAPAPVQVSTPATPTAEDTTPAPVVKDESHLIEVKSPMIGTFYRSANPESPMFVNIGDKVEVGNPVCIIEAMKLFNEIESEVAGTIVKVLVENAQPVEYDQPLFLVDPS